MDTNVVDISGQVDGDGDGALKKIAIQRFTRLHGAMFGEISGMLKKAKLSPMEALQANEPSFSQMAESLEEYLDTLEVLRQRIEDIEVSVIEHAKEYLQLIKNLATAIDAGCTDMLGEAIAELDEKPYI